VKEKQLTAFLRSNLPGNSSRVRVASCPPSFKRLRAPSRASPPRLWARFLRFCAVASVEGRAREGFVDPSFSLEEAARKEEGAGTFERADRDALAR
jgi:hypothetical protein